MRLSYGDKTGIKSKILTELYGAAEETLQERKTDLAAANRDYYLAPLLPVLSKLPEEMVTHHRTYHVKIRYTSPNNTTGEPDIDELWTFNSTDPVINPHALEQAKYGGNQIIPSEGKLDPRLFRDAADLAEDIISLAQERHEMREYIEETFGRWSGSLQLKKVWPATLHKFLPAEPIKTKAPNKRKKPKAITEGAEIADAIIPGSLNTRLTTNLLEGT